MRVWAHSQQGKRAYQEDRLLCDETRGLFMVVDGMGGHANSDLAAQAVVDCMEDTEIYDWVGLQIAMAAAEQECSNHRDGRGAVATAVLLTEGQALCAHVGDTRCYLIRGKEIERKTVDQAGPWDGITNFFGSGYFRRFNSIPPFEVTNKSFDTQTEDIILLVSDGVSWSFKPVTLQATVITALVEDEDPAQALVEYAIANGSTDNCTAIVIEL